MYGVTGQRSNGCADRAWIARSDAAPSSWRANRRSGAGPRITRSRNANRAQTGAAAGRANAPGNGPVPDGGSVTFGLNGSWSGSNPVPVVALRVSPGPEI
ncbi:cellulose binding domain-containing protein [Streptomyces sp. NPDC096046]|uniref:cellulose binding domain-containing protein n=1 Tax=Streptomyces sp. NPDC096046 TaxID=3155542 RepID=UPI003323A201